MKTDKRFENVIAAVFYYTDDNSTQTPLMFALHAELQKTLDAIENDESIHANDLEAAKTRDDIHDLMKAISLRYPV